MISGLLFRGSGSAERLFDGRGRAPRLAPDRSQALALVVQIRDPFPVGQSQKTRVHLRFERG